MATLQKYLGPEQRERLLPAHVNSRRLTNRRMTCHLLMRSQVLLG